MALEIRDRVKETCTGTNGDMTLTGAVSGFVGFDLDATLDGDTIYYALEDADGTKWEVGLGTLSADSTSIERTTILATQVSFTDTTRQTFSGGTHTIFATYPASKAVYLDASGNLSHTVALTTDTSGNYVATITGGTGITSTGATSGEGIAHSLSVDASQTQITAVGTIATGTWQGTAIVDSYIASASTWNAKQAALTFGIADTNAVKIDGSGSAAGEYAKFTSDGIVGEEVADVKSDLSLNNVENTAVSTWAGTTNITTLGTISTGTWQGTAIALAYGGTGLVGATDGKIVVADGSGAPVAVQAFTANDGTLKHEVGGIEADISGIAVGDVLAGTGTGSVGIVTSTGHSDGDLLTIQADGTVDWETPSSGGASNITGLSDCLVENNSIFLGNDPSSTTSSALYNIGLGTTALEDITTGDGNVAIGYNTSKDLTTGQYSVAIGYEANVGATTFQHKNIILGYQAGESTASLTNRSSNIIIGPAAGKVSHVQDSVIIGPEAGKYIGDASNTEAYVVAIGGSAMSGNSSDVADSYGSIGIGRRAGGDKGRGTAAHYCIYLGWEAGYADADHASNMLYIANDEPSTTGAGGTIIKADMEEKHLAIGQADLLTNSAGDGTLQVYPHEEADDAFYAKMAGTHTGNLIQIQNSSGTDIFVVNSSGQVSTGTWQGTAIAQAYIANDAINGDKIADDAVDSEHYAAGSIDEEHLNATNTPTDNYILSYDDASGGFTWVAAGAGEANEYSFKTISVAGQDDVVADTTTDTLTLAAGSNVTITTTAASDTVTIAATDTNTQLSQEQVEDFVGGMLGGTETLITVTYQDGTGDIDFVVDNDLSNYDNSSSGFITATLTEEQVEDFVGGMLGGTETGITVTYQDDTGDIDFVVSDTTVAGDSGSTAMTPGDTLTIAGGTNVTTAMSGDTLTITATDTNTMGSGFTVSATTDSNATTITQGDDLMFAAGTGITCETTADGTVTISCTVTDTNTTYTKASFDVDHLFTLVGASADTDEHLSTFTGSTIADNQTIKAALQALETAVETKGATAGSSSIVTVGTISSGTWQGTAIAHAYIGDDAIDGDNIADDSVNSEHYVDGSIDTAHIGDDQVTYAKIQNVSSTDRILGRDSAGAGVIEEITPANLRTMINVEDGATADQTKSDIDGLAITTVGTIDTGTWQGTAIAHAYIGNDAIDGDNIADDAINSEHYVDGSIDTAHIADDQVTYAKVQNVSATSRVLGRITSGAGVIEELTGANIRTIANVEDGATADQTKSDIDGLGITTVGTIDTGVWQGTAIATAYIADDAITGAKIALFDDSLAATTTHFLIADGTDYSSFALSGDVTCTNAGVVSIADDVISSAELADACTAVTSFTAPLIEGSTSVQTPLIEYTDGDDAITIHDGGSISMAKAVFHPIANAAAEPEDATVNIDLRNANYFDVELGANVTDIDFTYGKIGQRFMIRFEQDASSGPYTIAWNAVTMDFDGGGSPVAVTISWPGGTAPTMTATDDKADTYGFVVRAEGHMDGFIIGQNMPVNDN